MELIVSSQLHIERNAELVASRIEISEWMNVSCNELWTHQPHVKYVFKQGLNDERAVALKQADEDFKNRIKEMEIDLESFKTEVEDRKDARQNFATDWTPKVFSILSLLLYGCFVMIVTLLPHDQNDETIISLVLGQLSGILGTAAAFFYGGSSGKK